MQRINKQIDSHKKDKESYSVQLEKVEQLKVQLEVVNSQILSYSMKTASQKVAEDVTEQLPELLTPPESNLDIIPDDHSTDSAGLLPE